MQVKHFESPYLFIVQQANSKLKVGRSIITSPKTKESVRRLVLPTFLCEMLSSYIKDNNMVDDGFLFPSSKGKRKILGETTLNRYLSDYCKKAFISHFNFHMFRHTEATVLMDSGLDSNIVASYLGHSSSETTERYYVHRDESDKEKVSGLLDDRFKSFFFKKF